MTECDTSQHGNALLRTRCRNWVAAAVGQLPEEMEADARWMSITLFLQGS
jgi:hypothetical protein